jgi:signal transduction histidine kinase
MDDRRELERRLHDGVQQELVAIAVRLQLARGLVETDPPAAQRLLDELGGDVSAAIDELRAVSALIYQPFAPPRGRG